MPILNCNVCETPQEIEYERQKFICYLCDAEFCYDHIVKCKECKNNYCQKCLKNKHFC